MRERGEAFLQIMRGFELGAEKEQFFRDGLAPDNRPYPVQVVWGDRDPALPRKRRIGAQEILGVDSPILLPAKHFLQEDRAEPLTDAVVSFASAT
jgi:hypothetical protein